MDAPLHDDSPYALVVDDDWLIRTDAMSILEDAGFRTLEAADPEAALAILIEHHAKIVLLFTDVEMPGPGNGFALARETARCFVNDLRSMNVRAHVARNTNGRRSSIDGRTTRHAGYGRSQKIRKRIEEGFGWIKTVGGLRKTRFKGRDKVGWAFALTAAAYNLVRLPKLLGALA